MKLTQFELSRAYWDYAFEHPGCKPTHAAIFFFAIEHCNRLGWKRVFGFPTTMAKEAAGIHSYNTYILALRDLVEWGFIIVHEWSRNQYSANKIELSTPQSALSKNDKALDKALTKHYTKQGESTVQSIGQSTIQSIDSIDKQRTIEQVNQEPRAERAEPLVEIVIDDFDTSIPDAPGGGAILDPDLIDRVPIFGKIKIHQQSAGVLWTRELDIIAQRIIQRMIAYLNAHQGAGTYDDDDLYAIYLQLWAADNWHMRKNPSLDTLDRHFDKIVGSLQRGTNQSDDKRRPGYTSSELADAIAQQLNR